MEKKDNTRKKERVQKALLCVDYLQNGNIANDDKSFYCERLLSSMQ